MHQKFDFFSFLLIVALGSLSLLTIFAVNRQLFQSQLIFWAIGLIVFYVASRLDYLSLKGLAPAFYVFSILCLIAVFMIGEPIRGSIRWIDLGPFRFQPSELTKVAIIFLLGSFYSQRNAKKLKNLLFSFAIVLPAIALIYKEPDLGNALSVLAIWLGMSLVAGFKIKHFIIIALAFLLVVILGFEILSPYQKTRIESFLNPQADPLGAGYNIIQSKIAVGSGGFFGKGLGHGSQSQLNFLPEAESDFLFASLSEQLGLIGATLLLAIYTGLLVRLAQLQTEQDHFAQLLVAGTLTFLVFQFLVNIGMNLGLLPVTGITLPLISYGGSSLISTLFLLGIVFSIQRHRVLTASV